MIILNLKGGLGNQIFQYAAALKYALIREKNLFVYTGNLAAYKTKRNFSLSVFIDKNPKKVSLVKSKKNIFMNRYFLLLLNKINLFIITEKNYFVKQFPFINIIDDYFLDARFVDEDVLSALRQSLDDEFLKSIASKVPNYLSDDLLGIHLRGTDRSGEQPNFDYEAILKSVSNYSVSTIICFTDDILYAKDQLKNLDRPVIYLTDLNLSDIEEFYLISKIKNFVVSNSTFSVFARRLSLNETCTYVVKDFFKNRDTLLLDVFNFKSKIYYL
jgi:hypothetical protein